MKNLLLLLMTLSLSLTAQITVEESVKTVKVGEISTMASYISCSNIGGSYTFFYTNAKYPSLNDMRHFTIGDEDSFNALYDIIKSDLVNHPEDNKRSLSTPNLSLTILYVKNRFQINVHEKGKTYAYTYYFNGKKLDKLFGKVGNK